MRDPNEEKQTIDIDEQMHEQQQIDEDDYIARFECYL